MSYETELRELNARYREITGRSAFGGMARRGPGRRNRLYMFDTGDLDNAVEALGYLRERVAAARSGRPEPCIVPPGQPCTHTPQHKHHRGEAAPP